MYEYQTRIRYSELDAEGHLTLPALLDYFQDCSTFQSEDLGVGMQYCLDRELLWALAGWQIVVKRYPTIGERVTVGTLPYQFKGFMGLRNFWMKDEEGNELAVANSIWTLIHLKNGTPQKVTPEMYEGYKIEEKIDMDYAPRHITFEGDEIKEETVEVTKHHLDMNQHVNNGQFVKIAMGFVSDDFKIGQLRAEYKVQAHLGTIFYPVTYHTDDTIGVDLADEEGKSYCRLEFKRS
ncbi:MAG: acyl-[acyl-carrier-protein] thioesterase [Lachnospiraceae bacterium]|nr:acyl-[acyl-carrier-protein] thioesterase [Lachnospiraceae bacterium]